MKVKEQNEFFLLANKQSCASLETLIKSISTTTSSNYKVSTNLIAG
jgi:hypothetical protein